MTCCARNGLRQDGGRSSMIEMRRKQLSFGDGLIAEEVSDLCENWMPHADAPARFDQLINWASVALAIPPAAAFLLAFEQSDNYDGGHFIWFRSRFDKFLYIDRVVV